MLLQELQVPLSMPPQLWCDNMGAISLASNPIYHARTKHVEVDYHFIREKVLHKDITISHLSTHDQCPEIFTKGLTTDRFNFLRNKLMIVAPPVSLWGAVKTEDHKDPAEAQELSNQQHNPTHSAVKNNQAESQPCDHARPLYHDPRIMHDLMLTYHSTTSLPYYADLIFLSFFALSPHCTLTSLTLFSPYLVFP